MIAYLLLCGHSATQLRSEGIRTLSVYVLLWSVIRGKFMALGDVIWNLADDEMDNQAGRKRKKTVRAKKEYVPDLKTANWVFLLMLLKVISHSSQQLK